MAKREDVFRIFIRSTCYIVHSFNDEYDHIFSRTPQPSLIALFMFQQSHFRVLPFVCD